MSAELSDHYTYAGTIPRFAAWLLDYTLIFVSVAVIAILPIYFSFIIRALINLALPFITIVAHAVYYIELQGKYGQTLGKKQCKIKVLNVDMQPIGYREAAIRYSPYILWHVTTAILIALTSLVYRKGGLIDETISSTDIVMPTNAGLSLAMTLVVILWFIANFYTIRTSSKKQALHDLLAKTIVVKV